MHRRTEVLFNAWQPMLGNEGEQKEEDCYHGDEDALRDPRSVETESRAKRRNSTLYITPITDRQGYAQWPSSLVWTCPKKRCKKRHPQSDGPGLGLAIPGTRRRGPRMPQAGPRYFFSVHAYG